MGRDVVSAFDLRCDDTTRITIVSSNARWSFPIETNTKREARLNAPVFFTLQASWIRLQAPPTTTTLPFAPRTQHTHLDEVHVDDAAQALGGRVVIAHGIGAGAEAGDERRGEDRALHPFVSRRAGNERGTE